MRRSGTLFQQKRAWYTPSKGYLPRFSCKSVLGVYRFSPITQIIVIPLLYLDKTKKGDQISLNPWSKSDQNKAFRSQFRGVRDISFLIFRLAKIFA